MSCQLLELPAGLSAASICRMQSKNASLLQWLRRLPTVARGLFVFQAGQLLGVKDEGMVAQQTQGQASA